MKAEVVAVSARGAFIVEAADGDHCVLSIAGTGDVDPGDQLESPVWDDSRGLEIEVRNITKRSPLRLTVEFWGMTLEQACEGMVRLCGRGGIRWVGRRPSS